MGVAPPRLYFSSHDEWTRRSFVKAQAAVPSCGTICFFQDKTHGSVIFSVPPGLVGWLIGRLADWLIG